MVYYLYRDREKRIRNWLMRLWRLRCPVACPLQPQHRQRCGSSQSPKARGPGLTVGILVQGRRPLSELKQTGREQVRPSPAFLFCSGLR